MRFPCNIQPYHETNPEIVSEEKFEKTGKNDCLKNVGKILLRGHSQPHLQIQKQNEKVKKNKRKEEVSGDAKIKGSHQKMTKKLHTLCELWGSVDFDV